MNQTRKTLGWAVLGCLLWALPAAAQTAGERCQADCASKAAEPMQACMTKCPAPGKSKDLKSMRAYQNCAQRCSSHFEERFEACRKKCPDQKAK